MGDMSLSRRRLLAGASATTALGVLGGASVAQAKAPMLNTPAPAFYRFKLGSIEATVVSDGPLSIGDPKNTFRGPTAEEIGKMMSDHFLPTNNVVLDQNVLVDQHRRQARAVRDRNELGETHRCDGPTGGQSQEVRHRSQRHRRGHSHARAYRPRRRDHGRGRQPQLPQRADLHRPVRLRILDRRQAARHPGGRLRTRCQEEPAAEPGPHRVLQGRPGRHPRRTGDAHARDIRSDTPAS